MRPPLAHPTEPGDLTQRGAPGSSRRPHWERTLRWAMSQAGCTIWSGSKRRRRSFASPKAGSCSRSASRQCVKPAIASCKSQNRSGRNDASDPHSRRAGDRRGPALRGSGRTRCWRVDASRPWGPACARTRRKSSKGEGVFLPRVHRRPLSRRPDHLARSRSTGENSPRRHDRRRRQLQLLALSRGYRKAASPTLLVVARRNAGRRCSTIFPRYRRACMIAARR